MSSVPGRHRGARRAGQGRCRKRAARLQGFRRGARRGGGDARAAVGTRLLTQWRTGTGTGGGSRRS
jgi:hypothetical protein